MLLSQYLTESGKRLADLAEKTGLSISHLSDIARGICWPGAHAIAQLNEHCLIKGKRVVTANDIFEGLVPEIREKRVVRGTGAKKRRHR